MPNDFTRFKVTYGLIFINTLFYGVSIFYTGQVIDMPASKLVDLGAIFGPFVTLGNEWWRLLTAMFLHGSMTHLLMNMFSLYIVGRAMELYLLGREYLLIYFITGILGGLVSLYFHPVTVGIGASGAIFGVFGALSGYFLAYRKELGAHAKEFMRDFILIIGINILLGFSIPNIDVSAHVGGLLSGILGGYVIAKYPHKLWLYTIFSVAVMIAFYLYLPSVVLQELKGI